MALSFPLNSLPFVLIEDSGQVGAVSPVLAQSGSVTLLPALSGTLCDHRDGAVSTALFSRAKQDPTKE